MAKTSRNLSDLPHFTESHNDERTKKLRWVAAPDAVQLSEGTPDVVVPWQ
jgi:hypothetical protein